MEEHDTKRLPMMPIREAVVFPDTMTPFVVGRGTSVKAIEEAIAGDKRMFLAAQRDASVEEPEPGDISRVGVIAHIVQSLKLPDGKIKVLMEGVERAELVSISNEDGFLRAIVRTRNVQVETGPQTDALIGRVTKLFERYAGPGREGMVRAVSESNPGRLADMLGAQLGLTLEEKQELLEIFDPLDRLRRVAGILAHLSGHGHTDVPISTAVLTRWAESCVIMNRLGVLIREEMEGENRSRRVRDLAERERRLAWHLYRELVAYGAQLPDNEPDEAG